VTAGPDALKARTQSFALAILTLARDGPADDSSQHIKRQLIRSATSVDANYRAALRSRSRAAFVARIGVVLEVADEAAFWLELLTECPSVATPETAARLRPSAVNLLDEANQLTAIFAATRISASQMRSQEFQIEDSSD